MTCADTTVHKLSEWRIVPSHWTVEDGWDVGSHGQYRPRAARHFDAAVAALAHFDREYPKGAPHRIMRIAFHEVSRDAIERLIEGGNRAP